MAESPSELLERRVLVLAPTTRDAEVTRRLLAGIEVSVESFHSLRDLCQQAVRGAAALILSDSAMRLEAMDPLLQLIEGQPPWSDLPILVLTPGGGASERDLLALEKLGNVILLDQPVRVTMLISAVRGALRSRERQYQLRTEIAAQMAAREALREADRRKDEFLATLGHELRNPLAAICSAGYVLAHVDATDPVVPRLHARIARQAEHLSRMVDDLLDVARITSGKIVLRCESVNLLDVARRAVESIEEQFIARGHELTQALPDKAVWVSGDPARLEQILVNLLSNAAKYTEPGGRITLALAQEAGDAVLTVTDTGIGIAQPMLPHIFDLFAQADRTRERSEGGLGIGLSLVQSLVRLHCGSVEAASAGIGQGTRFTVRLPKGSPADPAPTEPISERSHQEGSRVLVVDDNRDAGDSLGDLLDVWGYPHRVARSGREALEMFPEFHPTIVLLDLHMPGMSGFQVAEQLAGKPQREEFQLVALTGYGQDEDRRRTREAGFDHHLTKPVDPNRLRSLLSGHVPGAARPPADDGE